MQTNNLKDDDLKEVQKIIKAWKKEALGLSHYGDFGSGTLLEIKPKRRFGFKRKYFARLYTNHPGLFIGYHGKLIYQYLDKLKAFGIDDIAIQDVSLDRVVLRPC